jgi:glycerol-3-phosphate O-acyltransferase / dihydroxyacetone phosphate acyltransferase
MSKALREGKKDYSLLAYWYCKPLFRIGTNVFYRRFQMDKPEVLEKGVATVVVLNHANAFMDPVACAINFDFRGFYMARGDAFKNKFVGSILYGIGILPIFRMSDGGRAGVLKNDVSYKAFSNHLNRNRLIQIFPEAICVWEKKMRPIKKGTARMVLSYLKDNSKTTLKIQPVGLNYSCASKYGSDLFIKAGKPIDAGDFLDTYLQDENKGMMALTKAIEQELAPLMIQVNNEGETVFNILEVMLKNELASEDLALHFQRSQQLGLWVNELLTNTTFWHPMEEKVLTYNKMLKAAYYRDHLFTAATQKKLTPLNVIFKSFLLILGLPLFLLGLVLNGGPYFVIEQFAKHKVKERIFEASAKILLGTILFQLNWLLFFIIVKLLSGSWLYAGYVLLAGIFTAWFSWHFQLYLKKSLGFIKLYFNRNGANEKSLFATRQVILKLTDKAFS